MPFGIIAGIGAAAASLYGAISANSANKAQWAQTKDAVGLQDKYNKENADIAWARQKEMYDRVYKDESYANRVQQMKEAGLNVGLMYSGGSTAGGGAGTIGSVPQAQSAGLAQAPNGQAKVQTQMMGAQLAMQAAQVEADIKLKKAQADNVDADTKRKLGVDTENVESQTAMNWAEVNNIIGKTEGQKLQNHYQRIRNRIERATTDAQIERAINEADKLMWEAETAFNNSIVAAEDAARSRATTETYIKQQKSLAEELAAQVILRGAQTQQARAAAGAAGAAAQESLAGARLKGVQREDVINAIAQAWDEQRRKWDMNRITEKLGEMGIDVTERGQDMRMAADVLDSATDFMPK